LNSLVEALFVNKLGWLPSKLPCEF